MSSLMYLKPILNIFDSLFAAFKTGRRTTISTRLLTYVISFSSAFALIQTVIQLKSKYEVGIDEVQHQFEQIELSYVSSLTQAIWEVDPEQILNIATGISHLSNVIYVTVQEQAEDVPVEAASLVAIGSLNDDRYISRKIALEFIDADETLLLGHLDVYVSLQSLDRSLYEQTLFLLGFQALKTFSVSIFMLAIFHYLVTQHLIKMADFSLGMDIYNLDEKLSLERSSKFHGDELWTMSNAINGAKKSFRDLIESKQSTLALEMELQQRSEKERIQRDHSRAIEAKNNQLATQNEALSAAIAGQELAQKKLVQAEKLASLGRLVNGMAHELNTPLGVIQMTHSMSVEHLDASDFSSAEASFSQYRKVQHSYNQLINKNIQRSIKLIEAFKQVSNDEIGSASKDFNVQTELERCAGLLALSKNIPLRTFEIAGDSSLTMHSNAQALKRVVTQLLANSIDHARPIDEGNEVSVKIVFVEKIGEDGSAQLSLKVLDNGVGIDVEHRQKIFDPFYTGSMKPNHVGLGLHMVFNTVTSQLQGHLECLDVGPEGCCFELTLPIRIS